MIHVVGDSHVMLFTGRPLPHLLEVPVNYQPAHYDLYKDFSTYFIVLLRAYHIVPNTTSPQAAAFYEQIKKLPLGSDILVIAGEIDCRGPIINMKIRTGNRLEYVVEKCVDRFMSGVNYIKSLGHNPILFSPIPNKFSDSEEVGIFSGLPKGLATEEWCAMKRTAVIFFDGFLKSKSPVPIISLTDWIIEEEIEYKSEYWADLHHLSEKAIPLISKEFEKIGKPMLFQLAP